MKLLLVHNFYGSSAPSGENKVFETEREMLTGRGHEVLEYTRHSDEIRGKGLFAVIKGAVAVPWNPFAGKAIEGVLRREKPDIMHVHNVFPLLSPSIFHAARDGGTATVLTLHNYRTCCAAAIPARNGRACTECIDRRSIVPALKHGCYRESRLATIPLAASIALHRRIKTWRHCVDAFISLTEFQKELLVRGGLPAGHIHIKPHFYDNPPEAVSFDVREDTVVFLGRIGKEKGVHLLLQAWRRWGSEAPRLEIIGDGPERAELEQAAERNGLGKKIAFRGQLSFEETQRRLAKAKLLVLPSLCFEGFPMVIREAFALGVPVMASCIGALPYIVKDGVNGVLFQPGDADDLLVVAKAIWKSGPRLEQMAVYARLEFEGKYTAEENYRILMSIYDEAIASKRRKTGKAKNQGHSRFHTTSLLT